MILPFIYYSISIINAIVFLSGKKIKWIYVPSYIFLMIFASGKRVGESFLTYDISNYRRNYEYAYDYTTFEIGFKYLNSLCGNLGLSFDVFYALLMCTIIIFMIISIEHIGGNHHLVLFCWLSYFILATTCHLRNQSALAIMMLTILPFYTQKLKSKIWVLCFIILASLFHISFIVFIVPLALCYREDERLKFRKTWLVVCLFLFFIFMFSSLGNRINSVFQVLGLLGEVPEKYAGYEVSHTGYSSLLSLGVYLIALYSIERLRRDKMMFKGVENNFIYENIDMFHKFLTYSSFLLPLLLVDTAFYRYFRDLSFIAISYLGIQTVVTYSPARKRWIVFLSSSCITGLWFLFDVVIKGYWPEFCLYFFDVTF